MNSSYIYFESFLIFFFFRFAPENVAICGKNDSKYQSAVSSTTNHNFAFLPKEFHLKKIQGLEDLLNVTREDKKNISHPFDRAVVGTKYYEERISGNMVCDKFYAK